MSAPAVANDAPFGILAAGLVTSVGLGAAASCAAIRAGIRNPVSSAVVDRQGEPLTVHRVPLATSGDLTDRLLMLAASAVHDCLEDVAARGNGEPLAMPVPVILCLAEPTPSDQRLIADRAMLDRLADAMALPMHSGHSCVVQGGRPSVLVALAHARRLVRSGSASRVLIVATDSLLAPDLLGALMADDRLLTSDHSDGFLPGEAAGALLVGRADGQAMLTCAGLGFGVEPAPFGSGGPMRAEGLVKALRSALTEARCTTADAAVRVSDHSGEQYFFREAALALSRVWQGTRASQDWWLPAQCIGEAGAASGAAMLASAFVACRDGVIQGARWLAHASADGGHRAAGIFTWQRGI